MSTPDQQQDLSQVFATLQQSLYILFLHYKGFIKTTVLLLLSLIFYKFGNISVTDRALNQKNKLSSLIGRRISVRVEVPKRLQRLRKINILIFTLAFLIAIGFAAAHYLKYKPVTKNFQLLVTIAISTFVGALTFVNVYKFLLNKKFRDNDSLERVISKKLTEFQATLGPKVIQLLKHHLCRESTLRLYTSRKQNQCIKPDCKHIRTLYKTRNEALQSLVLQALNFQWCSICRKRHPFDEFLPFEFRQYHSQTDDEHEIQNKMKYLLEGLQRMRKWLNQTSPCNCSKLYWKISTEKILEYKRISKDTDTKLKYLQNKSRI